MAKGRISAAAINTIKNETNAAKRRDWMKLLRGLVNLAQKITNTQLQDDLPTPTNDDLSQLGDAEIAHMHMAPPAAAARPSTRNRKTTAKKETGRTGRTRRKR